MKGSPGTNPCRKGRDEKGEPPPDTEKNQGYGGGKGGAQGHRRQGRRDQMTNLTAGDQHGKGKIFLRVKMEEIPVKILQQHLRRIKFIFLKFSDLCRNSNRAKRAASSPGPLGRV